MGKPTGSVIRIGRPRGRIILKARPLGLGRLVVITAGPMGRLVLILAGPRCRCKHVHYLLIIVWSLLRGRGSRSGRFHRCLSFILCSFYWLNIGGSSSDSRGILLLNYNTAILRRIPATVLRVLGRGLVGLFYSGRPCLFRGEGSSCRILKSNHP